MKSTALWSLIVLNVVLLAVVVNKHTRANAAHAAPTARVGDLLTIPANLPGASNGWVFMLDTNNRILSGVSVDTGNRQVVPMPPLDISRLLDAAAKRH